MLYLLDKEEKKCYQKVIHILTFCLGGGMLAAATSPPHDTLCNHYQITTS